MICQIRGENFELHPSRVLIWPRKKILVVADIHLGKAQTFQQNGLWLPTEAHDEDLRGLLLLIQQFAIDSVFFLGDFVHSRAGVTSEVIEQFCTWRQSYSGEVTVIIGNHDRPFLSRWPQAWNFVGLTEAVTIGEFHFQHEPPTAEDKTVFTWCGHIHPKVQLQRGPERLSLPAFVITPNVGYLPAFSSLAGGASFAYNKKNRYFATSENQVVEVEF